MQDDTNRKNYTEPSDGITSDDLFSDDLKDALSEADDVILEALRRKELEDAIAETDREVAELAAKRKQAGSKESSGETSAGKIQDSKKDPSLKENKRTGHSARKDTALSETTDTASSETADTAPSETADTASSETADTASSETTDATSSETADAASSETADPQNPGSEENTSKAKASSAKDAPAEKTSGGKRPPRAGIKVLLFLLLTVAALVCVYLIRKYTPTSKRMSYTEYFGEMAANEAAIVLQDHNIPERALISENGSVYIPYELVRSSLNERFFWDETLNNVIFTTPLQTYEIPINSTSYTVIDGALTSDPTSEDSFREIILLRDDTSSALYLSMNFISEYTNVTCSWEKETQHIYLRTRWGDTLTATAAKDSAVRYQGGIKSPILTDLNKGDMVMVLDRTDHWMQVLTIDGFIGYVKSNRMSEPSEVNIINEGFTPQEYTSAAPDEKVSVVWHMLSGRNSNKNLENDTASMTGITAISPTWFSLADNDGNVDSTGSAAYVKAAHAKDLQVWGLVSDFSSDMDTSVMLASTAARRKCIGQLIGYAADLGLDGINLDFEYMEEPDALCYTQFVRELSIACRREGLIFSVDLVPPYDFNAYLNRVEIATVADYLITMGYDEHYAGSESAGSVASLPYEENAIQKLLSMGIPAKKLVSAVPFYTRIWYTSTDADGVTYVNSEELSMSSVAATLDSWQLTPTWDAESAQNYIAWYTDDGTLCEIWIEDAQSLQRKVLLTSKYDLGGTAIWALTFEQDSIWATISDSMNKTPEEAAALETQLIEEAAKAAAASAVSAETESESP